MPQPNLKIFPDIQSMSRFAAEQIVEVTRAAVASRGRALIALSGGSTPQTLFELLAQPPYRDQLAWKQIHFFWADERCVPPDHPQSNYGQAKRALFDHIPLPPENIHRLQGELEPVLAAEEYIKELGKFSEGKQAWPCFDFVLLGMGADGHTASLFPDSINPAEQTSPAIAVTASYQGRPAERVSLTPLVFNYAKNVLFLVSGPEKADALGEVLSGPADPQHFPAQRIRPVDGKVTWIVDEAAAQGIVKR
jgi:6-phosphogluconolactonase